MDISALRSAEILKMLKQNEAEWHRYQSQLKARRDRVADLRDSREEGIAFGDLVGRIHVCQGVLKLPLTPREELLALALEQLQAQASALEQEVTRRLAGSPAKDEGSA